jgi:hypothetical protein
MMEAFKTSEQAGERDPRWFRDVYGLVVSVRNIFKRKSKTHLRCAKSALYQADLGAIVQAPIKEENHGHPSEIVRGCSRITRFRRNEHELDKFVSENLDKCTQLRYAKLALNEAGLGAIVQSASKEKGQGNYLAVVRGVSRNIRNMKIELELDKFVRDKSLDKRTQLRCAKSALAYGEEGNRVNRDGLLSRCKGKKGLPPELKVSDGSDADGRDG